MIDHVIEINLAHVAALGLLAVIGAVVGLTLEWTRHRRLMREINQRRAQLRQTLAVSGREVCDDCGVLVRPEGGHRCGKCGRDI